MSRTTRRHSYWHSKEDQRKHLEQWVSYGWETEEGAAKKLAKFGTEAENWKTCASKVKEYCRYTLRAAQKQELHKTYKDWDHDYNNSVDLVTKGAWWYFD